MSKDSVVTVRVPAALKRRLQSRAKLSRRSLSAQLLHDLDQSAMDPGDAAPGAGRFLGRYASDAVPSDDDVREIRRRVWGRAASGGRHA